MGPARHPAHLRSPTLTSFHCTRGCPVLACFRVPWSAKNSETPAHGKRGPGPMWFPQVTQVRAIPTKVKVCPKLFYCHSLLFIIWSSTNMAGLSSIPQPHTHLKVTHATSPEISLCQATKPHFLTCPLCNRLSRLFHMVFFSAGGPQWVSQRPGMITLN